MSCLGYGLWTCHDVHVRRFQSVVMFLVAVMMTGAACSGTSTPEPPTLNTTTSNAIAEADAVAFAEDAVLERGRTVDGLVATPALLFGEWQVSFEPDTGESLAGGFLVVLDAQTGGLVDFVEYRG